MARSPAPQTGRIHLSRPTTHDRDFPCKRAADHTYSHSPDDYEFRIVNWTKNGVRSNAYVLGPEIRERRSFSSVTIEGQYRTPDERSVTRWDADLGESMVQTEMPLPEELLQLHFGESNASGGWSQASRMQGCPSR